jgi:23S rRNA pseudouridine1911/1915/1917 synthase
MRVLSLTVPVESDGQRVDVFLVGSCEEIATRSVAQKVLAGSSLSKNHRVRAGEVIEFGIPEPVPLAAVAEDIPLNIVFEDSDLIVIDKPRGLVVHPGAGHHSGTLVNALLYHCELSGIGGVLRPGIVHRLDKDTSGLMVVAKNDAAHRGLAAQLLSREMGRTYNAVCMGNVKRDKFRIDLPIGRHPHDRKKMAVSPPRSRNAVTNIRVLERFGGHTLIEARLETGRTHQIRVHMAYAGNPVLGDPVYGAARERHNFGGQILHAVNLRFIHPVHGGEVEFTSSLPEYFKSALTIVGGNS